MNKKQIYNILRNDNSLKVKDDLWNKLKNTISQDKELIPMKKHIPIYRLGLAATCAIVLMVGVIAMPRLNQIFTLSNQIQISSLSTESNKAIKTNTISSSSVQTVQSKAISNSKLQISSSKAASKAVNSTLGSSPSTMNPYMPQVKGGLQKYCNPSIFNYNHRLYSGPTYNNNIKPSDIIGYAGKLETYAIQGISLLNSICCKNTALNDNTFYYGKYDYLCDERITLQGLTYHLTASDSIYTHSDIFIVSSCESKKDINSNYNSHNNNDSYLLNTRFDLSSIVNKVIGQIPTGNVYSIDEIDPSNAIAIKANNKWFSITKEYGYSGKTIDGVFNDKGLMEPGVK